MRSRYSNSVCTMNICIIQYGFFLGLFETMFIYMVCVIGKIGDILGNCQICQNLTFFDNMALVVRPHIKKYMCNHSSPYDHLFPSVCSPIFPSVAHLKPIRIPSDMPSCMPIVSNVTCRQGGRIRATSATLLEKSDL